MTTSPLYNCIHFGDQYRITKFDIDGNIESSYLCDPSGCDCPAGVRPTCRHRQMLSVFLERELVNNRLFLAWDQPGHPTVDFQGRPAAHAVHKGGLDSKVLSLTDPDPFTKPIRTPLPPANWRRF